jgi:hypothetical protein
MKVSTLRPAASTAPGTGMEICWAAAPSVLAASASANASLRMV